GGSVKHPTYDDVCGGKTGHAEAVQIEFDPKEVSFEELLKLFWENHNPTTLNRQGPDAGPQYRSIVFYQNEKEKELAENYIKELDATGEYKSKIVTEVIAFELFYKAEEYHQDYEKNNPENPYIQEVSVPRIKRFESKFPELLK
ncbi:MAG: peptide-methionine (S)-S-oxide reductase MsrA, partial [Bacteroidetes bacterium]|nr:peptide-methionine (S)-S-oxide reductase MsrA [Bacteroidota bacterium]